MWFAYVYGLTSIAVITVAWREPCKLGGSYRSGGLTADIYITRPISDILTQIRRSLKAGGREGAEREDSTRAGGICLGVYEVHRICLD